MTDKPEAPPDERAKFEAYLREKFGKDDGWFLWVHGFADRPYVYTQSEWEAWQARAGQQEQAVLSDLSDRRMRNALYEAGWRVAARWAHREDLYADTGSAAYARDRDAVFAEIDNFLAASPLPSLSTEKKI